MEIEFQFSSLSYKFSYSQTTLKKTLTLVVMVAAVLKILQGKKHKSVPSRPKDLPGSSLQQSSYGY